MELTPLQIEILGAAIEGKLIAERKEIRGLRYLSFLFKGREVTRQVIALRKRGLLDWKRADQIISTPKGVQYWKKRTCEVLD